MEGRLERVSLEGEGERAGKSSLIVRNVMRRNVLFLRKRCFTD